MITLSVKERGIGLAEVAENQIPFALSRALNLTANNIQSAVIAQLGDRFTLPRPVFMSRLVKIENRDRATKRKLSVIVGIQGPRAEILAQHEDGGAKLPSGRSLAVPVNVRRNKYDIITRGNRPRGFAFERQQLGTETGVEIYRGRGRSFMVRYPSGRGWIFKRVGRRGTGRWGELFTGTSVLYHLQPKVQLDARLGFKNTAEQVMRAKMNANFEIALEEAMRTAVPREWRQEKV
jgi:hypothetical protein